MHILMGLLLARAGAQVAASYPEQMFRADGVERIEISGVRGRVTLKGAAGSRYRLRVRHSQAKFGADWGLSVERRGPTLHLEVYSVAYGAEWRRLIARDRWPAFDIELEGPARPATIGWRDGAIDVSDWRANVDASLMSGPIRVSRGAGRASLQASRGDVRVRDFNGDLSVHGEDGALSLTDFRGTSHLKWFSGDVAFEALRGRVTFEGESARVRGRALDGHFDLSLTNGAVELSDVAGRLRGIGVGTRWTVAARPKANVAIRGGRGAVLVTPALPTLRTRARASAPRSRALKS